MGNFPVISHIRDASTELIGVINRKATSKHTPGVSHLVINCFFITLSFEFVFHLHKLHGLCQKTGGARNTYMFVFIVICEI